MKRVLPYIHLMRPPHWLKSAFVVAPLFFALKWHDAAAWLSISFAVVAFAAAASAIYILNDWVDIEADKRHAKKSKRPLAAGTVKAAGAFIQAAILLGASAAICMMFLPIESLAIIGFYLILNVAYSFYFKQFSVLDVVVLACFYVLRVLMGCVAIDVPASSWIILATFFLSLTIGFAKRNADLRLVDFRSSRPNLQGYNPALIICLLGMCSAASLITYTIYVAEKQTELGGGALTYSVIFVAAGFFRFLQLALVEDRGGEPETIVFKDRSLFLICTAWLLVTLWSIGG